MKTYFVYIMTNKYDKVLYVGVTQNLVSRIYDHKSKLIPKSFTAKYNLTKLIYFENFHEISSAIAREKEIKGWIRKKKIALINTMNPEFRDLYDDIIK